MPRKTTNVFISYSHTDAFLVSPIVRLLRANKSLVFQDVDNIQPGKKWRNEIAKGLAESHLVVLFWCDHANSSDEVTNEWKTAIELEKDLLPLVLDSTPLPAELNEYQWIDFQEMVGAAHTQITRRPPTTESAEPIHETDDDELVQATQSEQLETEIEESVLRKEAEEWGVRPEKTSAKMAGHSWRWWYTSSLGISLLLTPVVYVMHVIEDMSRDHLTQEPFLLTVFALFVITFLSVALTRWVIVSLARIWKKMFSRIEPASGPLTESSGAKIPGSINPIVGYLARQIEGEIIRRADMKQATETQPASASDL